MNDDLTRAIEDRLRNLTPRPLDLDAEAIVSAATDEPIVPERVHSPVTAYRYWLPLAAACAIGMMAGSTVTALWMRSVKDNPPTMRRDSVADGEGPSVVRQVADSGMQPRLGVDDPGIAKAAVGRDLDARHSVDSLMTENRLFNRNGLSYSLQQQQFLSTSDSFAVVASVRGDGGFPATDVTASDGVSLDRSADVLSQRRDRLLQELLQM